MTAEHSKKGLTKIPHHKAIGIIGRCDSEISTPHLFFGIAQAEEFVRSGRLAWIVEGELARKTYLFDEAKSRQTKQRKSGEWIPMPSPAAPEDYFGPVQNVLQFV